MIRAFGVSETGTVRETNEDRFVADAEVQLFAVADGMGGHRAGEVASSLAIEALTAFVRQSHADADITWPYGLDAKLSIDGNRLRNAIHLANRRVFRAAAETPEYEGMGTTIVALVADGPHVAFGHVGDSRLYLLSDGRLEQLTEDDSWAAKVMAREARLQGRDLSRHPMRNVLTNVLGARDRVDVHMAERALNPGDVVLLCTDGVHSVLDHDAIASILTSAPDVEQAAARVIAAALDHASRDNVTAVVVKYDDDV